MTTKIPLDLPPSVATLKNLDALVAKLLLLDICDQRKRAKRRKSLVPKLRLRAA